MPERGHVAIEMDEKGGELNRRFEMMSLLWVGWMGGSGDDWGCGERKGGAYER